MENTGMENDFMKYIFLDIDGVLITEETIRRPKEEKRAGRHFCERSVSNLNRICATTGAKLVLSSSWRIGAAKKKLNDWFSKNGVQEAIFDFTPDLTNLSEKGLIIIAGGRWMEIMAWLKDHPETSGFVVLDDEREAEIPGRFVQTSMETGLTAEMADCAIKLLKLNI